MWFGCLLLVMQRCKPDMIAVSELRDKHAPQQVLRWHKLLLHCGSHVVWLPAACVAALQA
jgi:hypothetical protein